MWRQRAPVYSLRFYTVREPLGLMTVLSQWWAINFPSRGQLVFRKHLNCFKLDGTGTGIVT